MSKRTMQPKKAKRMRKHGFLVKMSAANGVKTIKKRRAKGRQRLAA